MRQFVATFFDHWGAVQFRTHAVSEGFACILKPVPRALSSSCGTCAWYEAKEWDIGFPRQGLEAVYHLENDRFVREV